MASSMVIPASKDTLFMRGFSSRQDIDGLRSFFGREGRCTVEFFKQSEMKDKLYVALRFESKDVAKDILNKFDNREVLGDRITISWFKDLRRARAEGRYRGPDFNRQHRWGGGNYYDRDQQYSTYKPRWNRSPVGGRSRRYDRSSSRSASRSSGSGSRSRSHSREKQRRHRSYSVDSRGSGKKAHTKGSGRTRRHKLSTRDDSTDKETEPTSRSARRRKLSSTSEERSGSDDQKDSKDSSNRDDEERRVACSRSSLDKASSDVDNSFEASPAKSAKYLRSSVTTVEGAVDANGNGKASDTTNDQKLGYNSSYPQQQQSFDGNRSYDDNDDSSPTQKPAETSTKRRKETRYNNEFNRCYEGYEKTAAVAAERDSSSPDHKQVSGKSPESETAIPDHPESPPSSSFRDNRSAWRPDDHNAPVMKRSHRSNSDGYGRERSPPGVVDDDSLRNRKRQSSVVSDDDEPFDSSHRRNIIDGAEQKKKRYIEDTLQANEMKADQYTTSRTATRGREDPGREADLPSGSESKKKTASGVLANRFCREMEKGALGLSQDKMVLVREKKDEIEKAYRQDCETFAVVVKMLVSKDTKLEDQLQFSLRENLKDIGQRCIHELREFIEQLKSTEDMQL